MVFLSLVLRLLWLNAAIEGDEGFFGYNAMLWHQGYLPYVYSTPDKGPLLYLFYLLPIHFFGNTIIPIRLINNIFFVASLVILYLVAKGWYGKKVGLIAALFYGIFMNAPVFEGQIARTESLSVPFVVFSIYCCDKYLKGSRKILLLFSGILISFASLILLTQAAGIIVLLLMITSTSYKSISESYENKIRPTRNLAADALILFTGVFLPVLVIAIYFWSQGALYNLIECVVLDRFTYGYVRLPNVPAGHIFLTIAEGLPLWLSSVYGFILCAKSKKYKKILVYWMVLFLCVASIPPNFGHHYLQVVAPASILSGIALAAMLNNITSMSVGGFFGNRKQKIATLYIVIIILSFIPSTFLQFIQYPDLHIHWWFIDWDYGGAPGPWTYDKQLELGNFLETRTSSNEQIFVHAWWATPYWLSEHSAPSKFISTVRDPLIHTIPEEEFQRLANMVKNRTFTYIIIVSQNLEELEQRREGDPIINYTLQEYFFVKSIVNAQIFSKYK